MFTGLIESTGRVRWVRQNPETGGVSLALEEVGFGEEVRRGESVAVNGCCLTLTRQQGGGLHFDLLQETLDKTNLKGLRPGHLVNLERCVTPATRLGGHFVQGHVDCVGEVLVWRQEGADWRLEIGLPPEFAAYVAYKGSIAVDGISLTVAGVEQDRFRCWIIPHTRQVTNLAVLEEGAGVNLEFDLLAKYVERVLLMRREAPTG